MKRKGMPIIAILTVLLFTGCAGGNDTALDSTGIAQTEPETMEIQTEESEAQNEARTDGTDHAVLLYQGQASIRIITTEGKVIYVDPYAGNDYELYADLILVTHPRRQRQSRMGNIRYLI